jgi:hypothetical protein
LAYTVATRSLLRAKRTNEATVTDAEQFAALLDAGLGEIDTTSDEAECRLLCEEVRISCTYGMLLCIPESNERRTSSPTSPGSARPALGPVIGDAGHRPRRRRAR